MHHKPFLLLAILGLALVLIGAVATVIGPGEDDASTLPGFPREASGLAMVSDKQLLVHNDEKGHIYSIALPGLEITRLVSLGKPVVKEDFEGIAINGNQVYLITSTGILYVMKGVSFETTNQLAKWQVLDTGLARICEVEGLRFDRGKLLIPCKTIYENNGKSKSSDNKIAVYSFMPGTDESAKLLLTLESDRLKGNRNRITAIETDAEFYYLLTPVNILRIHRGTLSLELLPLDTSIHKQPEGLALTKGGAVFLVDDRKKDSDALTRYESIEAVSEF